NVKPYASKKRPRNLAKKAIVSVQVHAHEPSTNDAHRPPSTKLSKRLQKNQSLVSNQDGAHHRGPNLNVLAKRALRSNNQKPTLAFWFLSLVRVASKRH